MRGDYGRRPAVQSLLRSGRIRLLAHRTRADRCPRLLVLRRQAVLAARSGRHLPALGGARGRPAGVAGHRRRHCTGGVALATAPENRARAAGGAFVLYRYAVPRTAASWTSTSCCFPTRRTSISTWPVSASRRWLSRRRQGNGGTPPHRCSASQRCECGAHCPGAWPRWATLSWRHASLYSDGSRFFAHIVSYNATARDAHLNLGSELLSRNRLDEALDAYRIAEEQRPDDCKPAYGAGLTLFQLGRLEEAEVGYLRRIAPVSTLRQGPYGFRGAAARSAALRGGSASVGRGTRNPTSQRERVRTSGPHASTSRRRDRGARQHRTSACHRTVRPSRTGNLGSIDRRLSERVRHRPVVEQGTTRRPAHMARTFNLPARMPSST